MPAQCDGDCSEQDGLTGPPLLASFPSPSEHFVCLAGSVTSELLYKHVISSRAGGEAAEACSHGLMGAVNSMNGPPRPRAATKSEQAFSSRCKKKNRNGAPRLWPSQSAVMTRAIEEPGLIAFQQL